MYYDYSEKRLITRGVSISYRLALNRSRGAPLEKSLWGGTREERTLPRLS